MTSINDYRFVFRIKSPHWDEKPNTWKKSEPVTLGEILEYGLSTQLDFTDGGYIIAKEIDWETDTITVDLDHDVDPGEDI